jgi:prepilin-type N-terminal cleavage/methylation domain-containing protein
MLKLNLLIIKNIKTEQGFTMLEILVAILIALGFVAVSLQGMVVATAFRVKAQEKQIANQLIQEDVENINAIAALLDPNPAKCWATNYNNGYAKYLWDSYTSATSYSYAEFPERRLLNDTQGKRLRLRRIHQNEEDSLVSYPPHQALKILYEVQEWDGTSFIGNVIAKHYIEVIPNAALSCP